VWNDGQGTLMAALAVFFWAPNVLWQKTTAHRAAASGVAISGLHRVEHAATHRDGNILRRYGLFSALGDVDRPGRN